MDPLPPMPLPIPPNLHNTNPQGKEEEPKI